MKKVIGTVLCSPLCMLSMGLATSLVCTGVASIVTAAKSKPVVQTTVLN